MKRFLCLLFIPAVLFAQEEPFPPQAIPPEHYQDIMARSPFVLPTATEEVKKVDTAWTNDFRIVSVVKSGDETLVLAKKVSTDGRMLIRAKENALGIRLVELKMAPDPRNVSAVVEKGGSQGTIQYDASILSGVPRSVAPNNPALKAE